MDIAPKDMRSEPEPPERLSLGTHQDRTESDEPP